MSLFHWLVLVCLNSFKWPNFYSMPLLNNIFSVGSNYIFFSKILILYYLIDNIKWKKLIILSDWRSFDFSLANGLWFLVFLIISSLFSPPTHSIIFSLRFASPCFQTQIYKLSSAPEQSVGWLFNPNGVGPSTLVYCVFMS